MLYSLHKAEFSSLRLEHGTKQYNFVRFWLKDSNGDRSYICSPLYEMLHPELYSGLNIIREELKKQPLPIERIVRLVAICFREFDMDV